MVWAHKWYEFEAAYHFITGYFLSTGRSYTMLFGVPVNSARLRALPHPLNRYLFRHQFSRETTEVVIQFDLVRT